MSGWRASGEAADDYARRRGWKAGTLKWWSGQLRRAAATPRDVGFVRLVGRGEASPAIEAPAPASTSGAKVSAIEVVLGPRCTVRVSRGADLDLFRAVVIALGGR